MLNAAGGRSALGRWDAIDNNDSAIRRFSETRVDQMSYNQSKKIVLYRGTLKSEIRLIPKAPNVHPQNKSLLVRATVDHFNKFAL